MKFSRIQLPISILLIFIAAYASKNGVNLDFYNRNFLNLKSNIEIKYQRDFSTSQKSTSNYVKSKSESYLHVGAQSGYYDTSSFPFLPNPADMTNEGNVQRVLSVLDGNIKQWSFIEAQLLEPNVNLGMVFFLIS